MRHIPARTFGGHILRDLELADAWAQPAPIPAPYVITEAMALEVHGPNASHFDGDVMVLRSGVRIALGVALCCHCDAPLSNNFCRECGE